MMPSSINPSQPPLPKPTAENKGLNTVWKSLRKLLLGGNSFCNYPPNAFWTDRLVGTLFTVLDLLIPLPVDIVLISLQ